MYCSSNDQVKSSMLLGQRRRRPVCHMLKVDILERQDHRESLSAVNGVGTNFGVWGRRDEARGRERGMGFLGRGLRSAVTNRIGGGSIYKVGGPDAERRRCQRDGGRSERRGQKSLSTFYLEVVVFVYFEGHFDKPAFPG